MTGPQLVKTSSHWFMTVGEVLFILLMLGWLMAVIVADDGAPLPRSGGPATVAPR